MNITVETVVRAPIEKVWSAYTTPSDVTQWNYASDDWQCPTAASDLRVGGEFSWRMESKDGRFGFDFVGTCTKVVPREVIEYSFDDRVASVQFAPGAEGVIVRVKFEAENEMPVEHQRGGWQAILNNLKRHVEGRG